MLKRQREILIGTILGDAWLQGTGRRSARLRLEHSEKQREYIFWKYEQLKNLMQDKPKRIERFNPIFKKTYVYYRCQSHSSPTLGKYRRYFYDENGRKRIPEQIEQLLRSPLTLAVWYMDDGHYYARDQVAYIYMPKYSSEELERLCQAVKLNFNVEPKVIYKKGYPCLYFPRQEASRLLTLIDQYLIESMRYKTSLNPVTTEGALPEDSDARIGVKTPRPRPGVGVKI
jgi:hypothetical protein